MNIRGKILELSDTQQVTDTFKKREFILEYAENPQYPEFIKFELIQDKCDLLNDFQVGQDVEVHFNLKGRKWTDPQGQVKYFNSLQAWRLDGAAAPAPNDPGPGEEPAWLEPDEAADDDLPF